MFSKSFFGIHENFNHIISKKDKTPDTKAIRGPLMINDSVIYNITSDG